MDGSLRKKLTSSARQGLKKGWEGFIWLLKILVPVSLLTFLLDFSGWLTTFDVVMVPVMKLLCLPPQAMMPILAGILVGPYATVASLGVLSFSTDQATLIVVFVLISHNLIQEGIIQGRSGLNPLKATLFRLVASVVAVMITARFMGSDTTVMPTATGSGFATQPILLAMKEWALSTLYLCAVILVIIMILMMLLETLKQLNWIDSIIMWLHPCLRVMGLEGRVGMLWLTGVLFGLSYGAVAIVQEAKERSFEGKDLERLQLSIGINHSMLEDPALFLPFGIGPFWLWIPRLVTAIVVVYVHRLWYKVGFPGWMRT